MGQVTIEYFILFAIVALVTIVALTNFDDEIKTSLEGLVGAAATKMAVDQDQSGGGGGGGGGGGDDGGGGGGDEDLP